MNDMLLDLSQSASPVCAYAQRHSMHICNALMQLLQVLPSSLKSPPHAPRFAQICISMLSTHCVNPSYLHLRISAPYLCTS